MPTSITLPDSAYKRYLFLTEGQQGAEEERAYSGQPEQRGPPAAEAQHGELQPVSRAAAGTLVSAVVRFKLVT